MADPTPSALDLALPAGSVLLHIGPSKTGTTALQAALFAARPALQAQGVHHAGATPNPARAVQALTGRRPPYGEHAPSDREWRSLAASVRRSSASRVLVSSEMFALAQVTGVGRAVADLGGDRVHVVVTLRPLARILPSAWQQTVKYGLRMPFDRWLRDHLASHADPNPGGFWQSHRHDLLVGRWGEAVGIEHVTVVVVDESDRDKVLRVFERLLDVRAGTLALRPGKSNRSMTAEEIETIRQFNVAFTKAGLDRALHSRVMGLGASRYLAWAAAEPGQRPLRLPPWAAQEVAAISSEVVAGLRASGARVVGDLDQLDHVTADDVGDEDVPSCVPAGIGGRLAAGVVVATGRGRSGSPTRVDASDHEGLANVATRHLLLTLTTRARTFSLRQRTLVPATPSGRGLTPVEVMALAAFRDELTRTGLVGPAYDALAAGVGRFIAEEPAADEAPASDGLVPVGAAAAVSLATVRALGLDRTTRLGRFLRPPIGEPIEVARVPTRRVIGELGRRAVRR